MSHDSIVDGDWLPELESCQHEHYLPCCQAASDIAENCSKFLEWSVQAMGMTLN